MDVRKSIVLDNGLDLRQVLTTGSVLHINEGFDDTSTHLETELPDRVVDFIGKPVTSFAALESEMKPVNEYVKKKILEEGGGLPLHHGFTVYVSFSGYWENDLEPFDVKKSDKPLAVDLKESCILPGLHMAIESMLVGEMSVFLLSYEVMYGELGVPPRIKPKANCIFYIKLLKSILTPEQGNLDLSESMFERVFHKVKLMYGSGVTLYKTKNYPAAIQLFRKATYMLHDCRMADEHDEKKQEKMLIKLYTNLAICYNLTKQPLKACTACNELNRLNSLWNNSKALFQNAKSLRMIGEFNEAEKKLKRAMKLCPMNAFKEILEAEFDLLQKTRNSCNQSKLVMERITGPSLEFVSEGFKQEVDKLIRNFKENVNVCKLVLPEGLNDDEIHYVEEACVRESLFFSKIQKKNALDKDEKTESVEFYNDENETVKL